MYKGGVISLFCTCRSDVLYIYSFVKVKVDNRLLNAEDMIVQTLYSILLLLLIMNRRVPQQVTRGERLESCVEKDTNIVHVCGHGVARLCTERIDVRSSKRKNIKQVARKKKKTLNKACLLSGKETMLLGDNS